MAGLARHEGNGLNRPALRYRPGGMPPLYGDTAAALIVDDEPQLATVLAHILEREGYRCTVAGSAVEAREKVAKTDFAIALIDVMMPGESGLELAADLLAGRDDIAVVMVTGIDDPAIAELALEAGAYGYVAKPFLRNEVVITVANAGRRRCLEIEQRVHRQRLQLHVEEQAADLDDALTQLKAVSAQTLATKVASRFEALYEAAPDALIGVNADGSIALANAQAEELFGYPRSALIGQPVELLVPESTRAIHPDHRRGYVNDPRTRPMGARMQLAARRRDGTEFPAEISLSAIETDEGLLIAAAIRDVTDRMEAQAERSRLKHDAERERLERQLHQSQRLESLGQLAGGVAHDFNNLLAVILNYTSFIGDEVAAAMDRDSGHDWTQARADIAEVSKAAERAAQLTHQLLAFGRREVVQPKVLNVNDIVVNVEQLLRRTIGEEIELATQPDPELWPAVIDPGQLEQVLVNLVVNARDAMAEGGQITIDTMNVKVDDAFADARPGLFVGRHVRLRVSDTGTGMSPDVVARVFEPFFTTKAKGEGTGLGLATVYGIVKQADGYVEVYSETDIGTTVSVYLAATDRPLSALDEAASGDARPGGGETILVAEDEDAMREVTRRILTRNGYIVLAASGGEEAIRLAAEYEGEIHLLLTDVIMAGMLGKELAERVRGTRPDIRVLFMSGYAEPVLSSRGTLPDAVALVEKPFNEQGLLTKLHDVLSS